MLNKNGEQTPSVGKKIDVLIVKDDTLTTTSAQKYLDDTVDMDKRLLEKYRNQLTDELTKANKSMEITSRLITKGDIGYVSNINDNILNVKLANNVEAYDTKWKLLSKSNEEVIMLVDMDNNGNNITNEDISDLVSINDKVVIKDGKLCIDKNDIILSCNIVLCNTK